MNRAHCSISARQKPDLTAVLNLVGCASNRQHIIVGRCARITTYGLMNVYQNKHHGEPELIQSDGNSYRRQENCDGQSHSDASRSR